MRVLMVHNHYQIPGGEDSVVRAELSLLRQSQADATLFSVTNDTIQGPLRRASGGIAGGVQPVGAACAVATAGGAGARRRARAQLLPVAQPIDIRRVPRRGDPVSADAAQLPDPVSDGLSGGGRRGPRAEPAAVLLVDGAAEGVPELRDGDAGGGGDGGVPQAGRGRGRERWTGSSR